MFLQCFSPLCLPSITAYNLQGAQFSTSSFRKRTKRESWASHSHLHRLSTAARVSLSQSLETRISRSVLSSAWNLFQNQCVWAHFHLNELVNRCTGFKDTCSSLSLSFVLSFVCGISAALTVKSVAAAAAAAEEKQRGEPDTYSRASQPLLPQGQHLAPATAPGALVVTFYDFLIVILGTAANSEP